MATVSVPLTKWFLDNGADPNLINVIGQTPLDFAASSATPNTYGIIDLLIL